MVKLEMSTDCSKSFLAYLERESFKVEKVVLSRGTC